MKFTVLEPQPPRRNPATLVKEPIATEDPAVFLPSPYDTVAPGLYPDEMAVQLDTGELVAVAVQTQLPAAQDNRITGGGLVFFGWARLINQDGSTRLDPSGHEIEIETRFPATPSFIASRKTQEERGEDRIARELIMLMLGEDPETMEIVGDPDAPPTAIAVDEADWHAHPEKAPPGTILNPEAATVPIIPWAPDVRQNNGIRQAIALAERASGEAGVDLGHLLAST